MNQRRLVKYLPLALVAAIILPSGMALADVCFNPCVISPTDSDFHRAKYEAATNTVYQFSLRNPPWNTTQAAADNQTGDSIWTATLAGEIVPPTPIGESTHDRIEVDFNSTHHVVLDTYYTHSTFLFLNQWNVRFLLSLDDATVCDISPTPNIIYFVDKDSVVMQPFLSFDWNLFGVGPGSFPSNPAVRVTFGDALFGAIACVPQNQTLAGSIGGAVYLNQVSSFYDNPVILITKEDSTEVTNLIGYQFQNHTVAMSNALNTYNQTGSTCSGFNIIVICLDPFEFINWAFRGIGQITEKFLNFIGGNVGDDIYKVISEPFRDVADAFGLIATITVGKGTTHPPGTLFVVILVYAACWGCVITVFTHNPLHIVLAPLLVAKWIITIIVGLFAVFFFYLPFKWIPTLISAIHAAVQAIRG